MVGKIFRLSLQDKRKFPANASCFAFNKFSQFSEIFHKYLGCTEFISVVLSGLFINVAKR